MHRFTASLLQTGLKHARKSNRTILQVLLAGRHPFAVQTPWGLSCLGVSRRALHTPSSASSVNDSLEADQKGEQAETVPDPISDTRDRYGLPEYLRPYQVEVIHACISALDRGENRIGVSSPTGSGKTVMFTNLIPLLRKRSRASGKKQILILVGAIELARQAMATISSAFPEYLVELEQGSNHASGRADVTVAMYQSMKNDRLNKYDPKRFAAVIVDEAHHSAAPSYVRLLSYFNSEVGAGYKPKQAMDEDLPCAEIKTMEETSQGLRSEANCPIIGFTATFSRHDEMALSVVFTHIVYHRDVWDMLQDGYLCAVRMTTIKAQMDLSEVNVSSHTGDFNTRALSGKVNTKQFNELIVGTWLDQYKQRKSTLIFCVDLAHVDAMTAMFRESGVDARSVSSHTQERVRKDLIQAFKNGEFPVLINCEILTEGTDIPNIDTVIVARPTKSRNLFSQMIGRGLRNAPGKAYCQIVDVVDNVTNVQGLISIPTLFGLDPVEDEVKDEAIAALKERGEAAQADRRAMEETEDQMASGDIVYEEDDDPFRLRIHDKRTDNDWRSRLSWVTCGDNKFVLQSVGTNGYFRIIKEGRIYLTQHAMLLPKELSGPGYKSSTPYTTTRTYGRSADLAKAFNIADKLVERIIPRTALPHLYRWASWRKKPASEAQKALLRKIYPDFETQVANNNVTSPQPRLQGSLIRPTLFNSPMPRLESQPVKTSMMIQERIRGREHRKDTQAMHWQYMRDMQAEVKFLDSLGLEAGKSSKSKLRKGERSDSLPETDWYMIHQEHLDRIEDSYIREQERASQMVPQAMLDEVAEAKKQRSQARASDKYETMTSGQAASMLTALKHGARAQVKARTKALTREEKKRVKLEKQAQKLSASVKVGEL